MVVTQNRKARRKEERLAKKKKKRKYDFRDTGQANLTLQESSEKKNPYRNDEIIEGKKKLKKRRKRVEITEETQQQSVMAKNLYSNINPDLAAAIRSDDAEIAELEGKLGIAKDGKERKRLHKEYKLEGYGEDFGSFLDDLDNLNERIAHHPSSDTEEEEQEEIPDSDDDDDCDLDNDSYSHLNDDVAAAMRADDLEIANLEAKMGLGTSKERKRLKLEYAKMEGYGDDFGDFLDDLDRLPNRLSENANRTAQQNQQDEDSSDSSKDDQSCMSEGEELVPMKDEDEGMYADEEKFDDMNYEHEASDEEEKELAEEPDHDLQDTYRPTNGEDIYGNIKDGAASTTQQGKYIPPHLRDKNDDDPLSKRSANLRKIQQSLNSLFNRLSEDSLISISQSTSKVYQSNPTADVNDSIWKNLHSACVARTILMSGLIPVYIACLAGVHFQTGDQIQLGGFLLEKVITSLWEKLSSGLNGSDIEDDALKKEACNLGLILCYLYNYSLIHCTFMYDIIRHLIQQFTELDIEILLLILSHCGYSLRSDDPRALKDIVLLVQERALHLHKGDSNDDDKNSIASSSRVQYMLAAMMDLKNNKKRQQDIAVGEKTAKLRKLIGKVKSSVATNGARVTDTNLRITLNDILNVETKGRWWKVGAKWTGNQYHDDISENDHNSEVNGEMESSNRSTISNSTNDDEELLKLASKHRMNTDAKRSVFCIIMGSADCDDAFEKLVRVGMLKGRSERDTVRVLMECCGLEKTYNPFYSHLASKICDYQPQCKFTFQLAFWDIFKQFDTVKVRKTANLSKLLFHLVAIQHSLKLNVLKIIDMSPDEISENAIIFLTIFFSTMFETFDDPMQVMRIFESGIPRPGGNGKKSSKMQLEEEIDNGGDELRENLSLFLLQTLKSSPKNIKKSKFRKNFRAAVKACETDGLDSMFAT